MVYKAKNINFLLSIFIFLILGTSRLSFAVIAPTDTFTILSANDLGMHCADQDYRIFSILPPYNVLNAQVLKKGGEPEMMSPVLVKSNRTLFLENFHS